MMRGLTMLGLGAGLMYVFDPDKGRRRRALMRDQLAHCCHEVEEAVEKGTRDLRNRGAGFFAELEGALEAGEAPDRVVEARVRSQLGRHVSHPGAIKTRALGGRVTLSGSVLAPEVGGLIAAVSRVRGVQGVENQLEVHEHAGNISALQGGGRMVNTCEAIEDQWMPGPRLIAGAAGGLLALLGTVRGGVSGLALGTLGVGLLFRSITNAPLSETLDPDRISKVLEPARDRLGSFDRR
ncbi:hypothetical protein BH23PLA1_BH23PLA1_00890 [soil metagenome]